METNKVTTSIRLDRDILDAVKKLADKDSRSLSNYIEVLLRQKVKRTKSE